LRDSRATSGNTLKTATQTIWKSADKLNGMRSLFVNPQIAPVFLLYRIGVFAVCAAAIIAASALIWLTDVTIRDPFVTRRSERLESRRIKNQRTQK
jgi:hypothetical protein